MKSDMLLGVVSLIAIIVIGAVAFSAVFLRPVAYPGPNYSAVVQPTHTVVVSATGSATSLPTQAQIYLTATGNGTTAQAATASLATTITAVNKTLYRYVGGNLSMISTNYYSLQKNTCQNYYEVTTIYPPCNSTGYSATESLIVTIPSIDNISLALTALANIPNVSIDSIKTLLDLSQISALRQEALQAALTNATVQAQSLAGNAALVARNISVSSSNFYPGVYFNTASASPAAKQVHIYGGTSSVVENIRVVFTYS
jgi:uncharacterized protein YggE